MADNHELQAAFREIQQARSDYQLANFVVFEKDTEAAAYAQCVLELQIKYNAIRRGKLHRQKLEIEAEQLREKGDAVSLIEAQLKAIDIEECELATLGAQREFDTLHAIWKAFPRHYTHAEMQAAQVDYWHARLIRQAVQDIQATGAVGVGNQDALRMAGITVRRDGEGRALFDAPSTPQLPDAAAK